MTKGNIAMRHNTICATLRTPMMGHPIPDHMLPILQQRIRHWMMPEARVPNFDEVRSISRDILHGCRDRDTAQSIISYICRIYLYCLAKKAHLNTEVFHDSKKRVRVICRALYRSANKFTSIKRKLRNMLNFLKHTMVAFVDTITYAPGDSMRDEPEKTLLRSPVRHYGQTYS